MERGEIQRMERRERGQDREKERDERKGDV